MPDRGLAHHLLDFMKVKMELKVWVDGIQRIVCGVNEATTCQDVVYALAHATGQTGRFTLMERWRNNERTLAPQERPLKVLSKWGEYSNDVQFILKRSTLTPKGSANIQQTSIGFKDQDFMHSTSPVIQQQLLPGPMLPVSLMAGKSALQPKEAIKKSLTFSGSRNGEGSSKNLMPDSKKQDVSSQVKSASQPIPSDDSREPIIGAEDALVQNLSIHVKVLDSSHLHSFEKDEVQDDKETQLSDILSTTIVGTVPLCNLNNMELGNKNSLPFMDSVQRSPTKYLFNPPYDKRNMLQSLPIYGSAVQGSASSMSINQHHFYHHAPPPPFVSSQAKSHPLTPNDHKWQNSPTIPLSPRLPVFAYPGQSCNASKSFVGALSPPPYRSPPTDRIQKPLNHYYNSNTPTEQSTPQNILTSTCTAIVQRNISDAGMPNSRRNLHAQFNSQNTKYIESMNNKDVGKIGVVGQIQSCKTTEKSEDAGNNANSDVINVVFDSRYRDLVRMVNTQRETLNGQQTQLMQCDAEIVYWEEKYRERSRQAELIENELQKIELNHQDTEEEVSQLGQMRLEDDFELGHQQERTLRSELTLLRSKLSNCETELLQCKNKIRLLIDEMSEERRSLNRKEDEARDRERNMLNEIDSLHEEIRAKIQEYDTKATSSEKLSVEIKQLEATIAIKKSQVEDLVHEMKEANLESLAIAPGEEIKHLEGGVNRHGITRKIMGSPRELENAVPTSKNPHGVWV